MPRSITHSKNIALRPNASYHITHSQDLKRKGTTLCQNLIYLIIDYYVVPEVFFLSLVSKSIFCSHTIEHPVELRTPKRGEKRNLL